MAAQKRNEWLDVGESDREEEDAGYDSEALEERKTTRTGKKRRTMGSDDDVSDYEETKPARSTSARAQKKLKQAAPEAADEGEEQGTNAHPLRRIKTPEPDVPDLRALSKPSSSQTKESKTGVIYISRIPPYMQPSAIRNKLEPFGDVGRIFLQPEDPTVYQRRIKSGGNKKRSFTDGWVEFLRKKDAKIVAESLNAQIVGGKKGSWYHDDVWNIKYLKGFKWRHLTEQISNETAERNARLRAEIAQTAKENKRFVENVDKAKMLGTMETKRKQREAAADGHASKPPKHKPFTSTFKQSEVKSRSRKDPSKEQPAETQRVLSKIF